MDRQLNVRIPEALLARVRQVQESSRLAMNALVEILLETGLQYFDTTLSNASNRYADLQARIDRLEARLDMQVESHTVPTQNALEVPKNEGDLPGGMLSQAVTTRELCKRLGIDYSNRNARASRHGKTAEEQLIAEALEKTGQRWRVCDRKGNAVYWERVDALANFQESTPVL